MQVVKKSSVLVYLAFTLLMVALFSCKDNLDQKKAENKAIHYVLDNRKDILVLDSAKFGSLTANIYISKNVKAKFALPYFTQVLDSRKNISPKMVQFLLDSTYEVIEVAMFDASRTIE